MADEVFASLPLAVIAFGARKGVDPAELMAAGELSPEDIADRDATVPYDCLTKMWTLLFERFEGEPLGIEYAAALDYSAGGVIGFVCKHCRTLGESVQTYLRFSKLLDPKLAIAIEDLGDMQRASMDHEPWVVQTRELIEMMVITFVRFTEGFVGQRLPLVEVCFRHPRTHAVSLYSDIFGEVPVRFDAAYTGVMWPREVLKMPFQDSDPSIRRYLEAHCEHLLEHIEAKHGSSGDAAHWPVDAQVREHIDDLLMRGEADIEHVARRMAMSTRSLQRALRGVDTSFREQLDEVRRTRSLLLLRQDSLSVQEIAFMLGYADPRNFYRSFKRWTQTTPTAYRRRQ